jgi:TupA-like ATPgrasp
MLGRNESLKKVFRGPRNQFAKTLYGLSPTLLYRLRFRLRKARWPNLRDPKSFDEKLGFLMLYWRHPLKTRCADKYSMRAYVREQKLAHLLPKIIDVYEDSRAIDFQMLPEQFVLKCTHGSHFNIICTNKRKLNFEETRRKLDAWMKVDYSRVYGEVHYEPIQPRIICEPFLGDSAGILPYDYKVYCFDGKAHCVMVCTNRGLDGHGAQYHFFDRNWKRTLSYDKFSLEGCGYISKVDAHAEIIEASEILSKPFPFVRLDFFSINGRAVISEMTFTPAGCIDTDLTDLAQHELGQLITLPEPYRG